MNNDPVIQENDSFSIKISCMQAGQRIDIFLSEKFPMFSRTLVKKLLNNQQVLINKFTTAKPSYMLKEDDVITLLSIPMPMTRAAKEVPDNLGITIVARHDDFLIINKPAGVVVHPPQETYAGIALTDWLIKEFPQIIYAGQKERPGIVHRLDRNTSGIMIIALTDQAHTTFSKMFKNREIQKTYIALVMGHPEQTGSIDYVISRHPVHKNMMHATPGISESGQARDALTNYKVLQYFDTYSLVQVKPKTGRTHQIRVHFKALGHALLGDTVYGLKSKKLPYHALHAQSLEFVYQGVAYSFTTKIDAKLQEIIDTSIPLKENPL
ncbi:RluA family pseudouridine synthase [Candidatus Chromulinivorax destructor]|uniref:Pseudouridine synthase n=1 Tax=Candidatus Chromulinivorax destructor TaxID=2066483 RepID=A0A345ZBK5_9BACT|nr:RluA family pseudouridine synthase [Candidatus Chromulinivorax destructor]AXK60672.1 RNA pseudouridine synthase [Candidatus Chromulinivorax destructor]